MGCGHCNLNGYVAIESDPVDGSPLTAWLTWVDEGPAHEHNDVGTINR